MILRATYTRATTLTLGIVTAGVVALGGCAAPDSPTPGAPSSPISGVSDDRSGTAEGAGTSQPAAPDDVRADAPRPRAELAEGGSVTLPLPALPTNFNRFHVDGTLAAWRDVTAATDPGLYRYSPTGEVSPRTDYLTAMPTVETRDGTQVITYDLNPKAVWNDGTPIDWTAFDATWKALRAPGDQGGYNSVPDAAHARIATVAKGSRPEQVVVTMKAPTYPVSQLFPYLLHPRLADPAAFDTTMKDAPHPELRSGPFTIASVDRQNGVVQLDRNPRWWGEKPLLDHVTFRQIEPQASVPAFRNSEIDSTDISDAARVAQIQGALGLDVRTAPRVSTTVLVFNTKSPALADQQVRKALWQAIDRSALARVRFNGVDYTEQPAGSALYQPFQPEATNNMPVDHDPNAATRDLEAAGWKSGSDGIRAKDGQRLSVRFTLHGDDPMGTALAQTVQTQLKAVGVDVVIDARPLSAFGQTMTTKDFDLLMGGGASDSPSPIGAMCQTMCSTSPGNATGVGTTDLDRRIAAVDTIADDELRAAEINAIEKEWLALYGQMPLWHGPEISAWRTGLSNLGPAGFASMTPVWENVGWTREAAAHR